jgi:hypothetical protein
MALLLAEVERKDQHKCNAILIEMIVTYKKNMKNKLVLMS